MFGHLNIMLMKLSGYAKGETPQAYISDSMSYSFMSFLEFVS